MKEKFGITIITILIFVGLLLCFGAGKISDPYNPVRPGQNVIPLRFIQHKDTVYVLGDDYIELSLRDQTASLFQRDGKTIVYNISSGSNRISKGIETPTGIFTVQSKYKQAVSKQFNNAKLFFWIGFNYNIGFHGLEGNGYYNYLGKKPSSHGCVRISREDGEALFSQVRIGTPIMVYDTEPARIFAFAEYSDFRPNQDIKLTHQDRKSRRYLDKRLRNLYNGKHLTDNYGRLFLEANTALLPGGIKTGSAMKLPIDNRLPILTINRYNIGSDKLVYRKSHFHKKFVDSSFIAID